MKLDHYLARDHIQSELGSPADESNAAAYWRPSKVDTGIELVLMRSGLFSFRINGNYGHLFKMNPDALTSKNLAKLAWSSGFSWSLANRLASEFGDVVHDDP